MKFKALAASVAVAGAVALGASACSVGDYGYQPAYVVGRTMCPNQYGVMQDCVIMSDGDLVVVQPNIWTSIMYGMILSPYSRGYHWVRPAASYNINVRRITSTTSYSSYTSTHTGVRAVSPSSEFTQSRSGNTYNSGGSSYKGSPVYKSRIASSKSGYSGTKSGYSGSKSSYSGSKSGYSGSKSSYSGGSSYHSSYHK